LFAAACLGYRCRLAREGQFHFGTRRAAILRELWQWREQEAIAYCRPPFFVLSHERMVDIADAAAAQQPYEPILPPKISPRRREPC